MELRLLKKVPLFSSLRGKELEKIANLSSSHKYRKDTLIVMES